MKKIYIPQGGGRDFWLRIPMNNESAGRHLCMDDVDENEMHVWLESGYGGCWTLVWEKDGAQRDGIAAEVPASQLGYGTYSVVMAGKFVNGDNFRTKRQLFIRLVDREDQADAEPTMYNEEQAYWAGPAVLSEMLSRDGLNTYELAVIHGFEGTLEEYLEISGLELQDLMVTKAKLSREVQTQLDRGSEKAITPKGDYSASATYAVNDLVYVPEVNASYVSLISVNEDNYPPYYCDGDDACWMKTTDGEYIVGRQVSEISSALTGYFTCGTEGDVSNKQVSNSSDYHREVNGGAMKVKMTNANTASNVKMQFANDVSPITLLYNGEAVDENNTWEKGEVISVYYDGTYNNNAGAYFATNAQGGGGKAEKIKYDNSKRGLSSENVQDAIDEVVDELYNKEEVAISSLLVTSGYCILGTGNWYQNSSVSCFSMPVSQGDRIRIVADSTNACVYAILKDMTVASPANFANGETGVHTVEAGKSVDIEITQSDAAYLYFTKMANASTDRSPSHIYRLYPLSEAINDKLVAFEESPLSEWTQGNGTFNGNTWIVQNNITRTHKYISRTSDMKYVRVTANSSNAAAVMFSSDYVTPSNGSPTYFIESFLVDADSLVTKKIPNGCNYIVIGCVAGTTDRTPEKVEIGYDAIEKFSDDINTINTELDELQEQAKGYEVSVFDLSTAVVGTNNTTYITPSKSDTSAKWTIKEASQTGRAETLTLPVSDMVDGKRYRIKYNYTNNLGVNTTSRITNSDRSTTYVLLSALIDGQSGTVEDEFVYESGMALWMCYNAQIAVGNYLEISDISVCEVITLQDKVEEIDAKVNVKSYTYEGLRLPLLNTFTYKSIGKITGEDLSTQVAESLAIYGNTMLCLYHTGLIKVYTISGDTLTFVKNMELGSADNNNHCNAASFSKSFYSNSDSLPLLYVAQGYSANCYVERVNITEGTSTLLQTITLTGWESNATVDFAIDKERNLLVVFGNTISSSNASNKHRIAVFDIPQIGSDVTLSLSNAKETYYLEDYSTDVVTVDKNGNYPFGMQDIFVQNGILYISCGGTDSQPQYIKNIWVWDMLNRTLRNKISLPVHGEPEGIEPYNGEIILQCIWNDFNVYKLTF